ncbi:MAG: hypothetical protein R2941_15785 [Desulfobacterales bacterium]
MTVRWKWTRLHFETCVKSKTAGNSVLGAKYRQIKDADPESGFGSSAP